MANFNEDAIGLSKTDEVSEGKTKDEGAKVLPKSRLITVDELLLNSLAAPSATSMTGSIN